MESDTRYRIVNGWICNASGNAHKQGILFVLTKRLRSSYSKRTEKEVIQKQWEHLNLPSKTCSILVHSFIISLVRSFIQSFINLRIRSLIHSIIRSLVLSFSRSFFHSLLTSLKMYLERGTHTTVN